MTHTISNQDDTIDSRDVIARIEELQGELEGLDSESLSQSEQELAIELQELVALQEEAEDYAPDWNYGSQLIRRSYFQQAMDELVADCYSIPELPNFMTVTLDYDALEQDYTSVDFDGVEYLIR